MRRPLFAPLALVLSTLVCPSALSDCTLKNSPYAFEPAGGNRPAKFGPGFTNDLDLYQGSGGERRLLVMENYGYATFSLANPAAPSILGYSDMSMTVPQVGDGQSIIVSLAAAPDGARALVNWKQSPYGTFLMKPNSVNFSFAGNFAGFRAIGGVVVDPLPTRSIAYALTTAGLYVSDVSSFVSGTSATQAGSLASQVVGSAPTGSLVHHLTRAGHFIVYAVGSLVVVVDGSTPGDPTSIPRGLSVRTIPGTAFGLGATDFVTNVAAVLHPVTGRLLIAAEGTPPTSSSSTGIGLVSSADGVTFRSEGPPFHVGSPYGAFTMPAFTMTATDKDVLTFAWEGAPNGKYKLVTLSYAGWGEGTDLSDVVVDPSSLPAFALPTRMRAFASGGDVYGYVAAQQGGVALALACTTVYAVGDADGDGALTVGDVFGLINYLFAAGAAPIGSGDVDGDRNVTVQDVFALVNYLFSGGAPPVTAVQ